MPMKLLRSIWAWLVRLLVSLFGDDKPVLPEPEKPKDKPTPVEPVPDDAGRKGFDPHFLPVAVQLPVYERETPPLLHYRHFSVAINRARKMPYYTAVNIDAVKYNALKASIPSRKEMGGDDWNIEPRIPTTEQLPASFYKGNDFDLGHMVRREDALWGDTLEEALAANDDTFYLTNAVPQHKDFNRNAQRWKGLEDYALKNARKNELRVSVFSGCVFDDQDRKLKGVQIPGQFWKIMVTVKVNGELSATGYLVQQDDLIKDITERDLDFRFEQFKTYQVPLTKIEALTGLQFELNDYDPMQQTRSGFMEPLLIEELEDIIL